MRALLVQNCEVEGFGLYERLLRGRAVSCRVVHAYRDEQFPALSTFDAVVVGGTPVSAYSVSSHLFLQAEEAFLREVVSVQKPCLGICCGAQLLAQVLGAKVSRNATMEIGTYVVSVTEEGVSDLALLGFPASFPVFQWHGDTFGVPAGADLLVKGDDCRNQMFRKGSVVGVQFHLEVGAEEVETWCRAYPDELARLGKSKEQVHREASAAQAGFEALAGVLIGNFMGLVEQYGRALPERKGEALG